MASIFKPTYTKTITGKKVKRKTRKYYVKYRDANGRWKRVPGYASKETTKRLADRLERAVEMEKAGLVDPFAEFKNVPILEQVEEYRTFLELKGDGPGHVKRTTDLITAICEACKFELIADISAAAVADHLTDGRRSGLSNRTSNYHRTAINGFCRWLVREKRMAFNPLSSVTNVTVDGPTRERRISTQAEFQRLITSAVRGPLTHRLSGEDRAYLYLVAANTGFRAAELASLTKSSFDFEHDVPAVTLLASKAKSGKEAVQPIRHDVAERLRTWLTGKPDYEQLWPGNWYRRAAEMLRRDQEAAEIRYEVDGKFFDFHSIRSLYITELVKSGQHPKVVQTLARHSTMELTMKHYTKLGLRDIAGALNGMPALPSFDLPVSETKAS